MIFCQKLIQSSTVILIAIYVCIQKNILKNIHNYTNIVKYIRSESFFVCDDLSLNSNQI